jgi:hypothetical protein
MCMQNQNIAKHTSTAGPQPCIAAASWQATHWRVIMTARVESRLAHTTPLFSRTPPPFRPHPSSNHHPYRSSTTLPISLPYEFRFQPLPRRPAVDPNRRLVSGKSTSRRWLPGLRPCLHRSCLWPRCQDTCRRRAHRDKVGRLH